MSNKIRYTEFNTTVYDVHKMSDADIWDAVSKIVLYRSDKGWITRTAEQYFREIRGHARLYKLGIMRSHTKDADLEEPSHLNWLWRIIG